MSCMGISRMLRWFMNSPGHALGQRSHLLHQLAQLLPEFSQLLLHPPERFFVSAHAAHFLQRLLDGPLSLNHRFRRAARPVHPDVALDFPHPSWRGAPASPSPPPAGRLSRG